MRRRRLQFILTLPLIAVIGFPWVALQSAAWAGMLANYAQSLSLPEAAAKTFDGKAPCQLCLAAARGLAGDDAPETTSSGAKFEWLSSSATVENHAPVVADLSRRTESISSCDSLSPPPPPPRLA